MKKQQSGFTLIELIMVIVILGVLSAFALPRFADFGKDARAASMRGIEGSVRSASAITRAAFLAGGDSAATTVTIEGVEIALANGYPAATVAGISTAAQVVGVAHEVGAGGGAITYRVKGFSNPNDQCRVTYTAATTITQPAIVALTEGC